MDINSLLSTMLSSGSVNGISQLTGSSNQDVTNVLVSALPSLLGGAGMQATAENSGFEQALYSHAQEDTSNIANFMSGVDMKDGSKILGHLLGANTTATTNAVAANTGVSKRSTASILSAAAPLLMSLLGQQTQASQKPGLSTANLIGSLLTGSLNSGSQSLLGSLLGAGKPQQSMGGSLLGALLGGGQTQQSYAQPQYYAQPQQSAGNSLLGALLGGGQTQQSYVQPQQPASNSLLGALLGGGQSYAQPQQSSGGLDLTSLALSALTGGSAAQSKPQVTTTAKKKPATTAKKPTTTTAKKKKVTAATTTTSSAKKKPAQSGVDLSDGVDANDVLGILGQLLK